MWDGWLVFFPATAGQPIAPPTAETAQPSLEALTLWAVNLAATDIAAALVRALNAADPSPRLSALTREEYEAMAVAEALEQERLDISHSAASRMSALGRSEFEAVADAERLEQEAQVARTAADISESAARTARNEADLLRSERLSTERIAAAAETPAETDLAQANSSRKMRVVKHSNVRSQKRRPAGKPK
jgi:hypothetical protein